MTHNYADIIGDGTLYTNDICGLISRHELLNDEMPADTTAYALYHPKYKRHAWILEKLSDETEIPPPHERLGFGYDMTPDFAFVYFCTEPDFDYLAFDDNDADTYIEWDTGHTMQDIVETEE